MTKENEEKKSGPVYALILAGGQSRRLGEKKERLVILQKPVLATLVKTLEPLCEKVFLSLRINQKVPPFYRGEQIRDISRNGGPLVGILSAMRIHPEADWLVVACDQILLKGSELKKIVEAGLEHKLGACFHSPKGLEPLGAFYRAGLLPLLKSQYQKRNFALHRLVEKAGAGFGRVRTRKPLFNLNTPEDLKKASRILGRLSRK
ncbi:MAG: molybdenum cofactor guanylyltransferase [Spirochaetia bacterium]|nr:molybdenum cofactor guanylyltransferase [Spirochaetia bacterium]